MMQRASQRGRPRAAARAPRRRLWPIFVAPGILLLLAIGWCGLWYYAANVADRTIAGWIEREAKAGRVYSCGEQTIGGFPFRIEARCIDAGADVRSHEAPFAVKVKDILVAAQVYHPTLLIGEVTGPLTLSEPGKPPSFIANWQLAQTSVRGLPPEPEQLSFVIDKPHAERVAQGRSEQVFLAERAELHGRIASGSASSNPVIETVLRLASASAPTLHPLAAKPTKAELTAVLRGLKDFSPKPWAERFREVQAAGGNIEIKHLRIDQGEIIVAGAGTVSLNPNGKLDGLIRVAIVGIERIVPLLGVDRAIAQGIDRLAGAAGQAQQGLSGLDRLMPGLGGALMQTANAALIDNIKKMGEPTEIDKKPAIVLPLRFSDGAAFLGIVPLGQVPPLF
jgi:hypothetical protein